MYYYGYVAMRGGRRGVLKIRKSLDGGAMMVSSCLPLVL